MTIGVSDEFLVVWYALKSNMVKKTLYGICCKLTGWLNA